MEEKSLWIHSERDIYIVLSLIRQALKSASFTEINQQKILVSVSELTRNILDHANRRGLISWTLEEDSIYIAVTDDGPGIHNLSEVLDAVIPCPGAAGLGLGLSGTKRLMDEFSIESSERGTKVCVSKRNASN